MKCKTAPYNETVVKVILSESDGEKAGLIPLAYSVNRITEVDRSC
jgi:hypothetical protein